MNIEGRVRAAMIAVLAMVLAACSVSIESASVVDGGADEATSTTQPVEDAPTEPGPATIPFHLDVSNQSFDEPEVRLRIWLDNRPIIDDVFPVSGQHHVVRHDHHLV